MGDVVELSDEFRVFIEILYFGLGFKKGGGGEGEVVGVVVEVGDLEWRVYWIVCVCFY